jgi:hypothetical protein
LTSGVTEADLLNYRVMTDMKKLFALKFLSQLQVIAYTAQPSLNTLLVMKMVSTRE